MNKTKPFIPYTPMQRDEIRENKIELQAIHLLKLIHYGDIRTEYDCQIFKYLQSVGEISEHVKYKW